MDFQVREKDLKQVKSSNILEIHMRVMAGHMNNSIFELQRSVVKKQKLLKNSKLLIFKSIFVSILSYGHNSWTMMEEVQLRVQNDMQ